MTEDLNELRRRAGLAEAETPDELTYYRRLEAKDFRVTPAEAAENMHLLNRMVPIKGALGEFLGSGSKSWMLTRAQRETMNAALQIVQTLMVPQALLKVEEPESISLPNLGRPKGP